MGMVSTGCIPSEMTRRSRGFTLVEIAIVVVIGGLVLSGVLKAHELIRQARSKSLVADFNGVSASVLAYRDRYFVSPGDDGTAATRWGTFGALSGNGNGTVEGNYNDLPPAGGALAINTATGAGESINFWWHLRLAGFVYGPTSGAAAAAVPVTAAGGILGVQTGSNVLNFSGLIACANDVDDVTAATIDTQLDDRDARQGAIRAVRQNAAGAGAPALTAANTTAVTAYTENGSRYIVCRAL